MPATQLLDFTDGLYYNFDMSYIQSYNCRYYNFERKSSENNLMRIKVRKENELTKIIVEGRLKESH